MSNTYKLQGTKYDIEFSFPFQERTAIRLCLRDKQGNEIERWEKKVSASLYAITLPFHEKAQGYIDKLMKGKLF